MKLQSLLLFLFAVAPALLAEDVPSADNLDALTDYFFRDPLYTSASLSPDCGAMAYRFVGDQQNAGLRFIDFENDKQFQLFSRQDDDVTGYGWLDNRTAFYFVANERWTIEGNTISLDKFRPRPIPIDGFTSTDVNKRYRARGGLAMVNPLPNQKSKILVSYTLRDYPDLLLLDVETGKKHVVATNDSEIISWYCDDLGVPWVVARRGEKTESYRRYYRYDPNTRESVELKNLSLTRTSFLSISRDGKRALIATDMQHDRRGICQYDLEADKPLTEIVRDPEFDMSNVSPIYVPHMETVVGAHVLMDKRKTVWFNPTLSRLQQIVDKAMPAGRCNEIIGFHPNGTTFFVNSFSDTDPREVVKVDLKEKKMDVILRSRPWIDSTQMAPMKVVRIPTPDGATIYGYLTLPKGSEDKAVPLIIDLIGGPGVGNAWGFDPEAQYYAAQGIGFLSLDYRGCTGYGMHYLGGDTNLRWAIEHIGDDTAAAARWAIEEGIARPDAIGVMGGSFGGYGALSAATRHPELFKAVASFAGVFDIDELIRADKRNKPKWFESFYAGLLDDKELVREMSPVTHVDKINAPVLLVHGSDDARVETRQAKRMQSAMKKAGKDVQMKILRDQGHNYGELRERLRTHKIFAEFMRKHLLDKA